MELTGATCRRSNLYQRLQRFQKKQQELLGGDKDDNDNDDDQGEDNGGGGKAGWYTPIEGGGCTPPPPRGRCLSQAMVELGVKDLSSWINRDDSRGMMTRRKRKSLTEAHSNWLMDQVRHLYRAGRYNNAFKACTGLLKLAAGDTTSRISVQKAVDRINSCSCPQGTKSSRRAPSMTPLVRGCLGCRCWRMEGHKSFPPSHTWLSMSCSNDAVVWWGWGIISQNESRCMCTHVGKGPPEPIQRWLSVAENSNGSSKHDHASEYFEP